MRAPKPPATGSIFGITSIIFIYLPAEQAFNFFFFIYENKPSPPVATNITGAGPGPGIVPAAGPQPDRPPQKARPPGSGFPPARAAENDRYSGPGACFD